MERETGTAAGLAKVILSVSHDVSVLETRNAVLRTAGFTVETTTSAAEAIKILQRTRIDAVVLGDSIPWEERNALVHAVRQIKSDVPVVALRRDNEPLIAEAECMGSLDGPESLIAKVRAAVSSR